MPGSRLKPHLEKLRSNILIYGIMFGQFEGHIQHVETKESHPCSPVRLAEGATMRNGLRAIKRTNIVESKESTLKDIDPKALDSLQTAKPGQTLPD